MKTRTPDLFTETVHQILRAARAEGATASVVTASFIQAAESVYGPRAFGAFRPAVGKTKKLSWKATARAMAKSDVDWSAPDHAGAASLKLSSEELRLHNTFGEEFGGAGGRHRRLVAAVDDQIADYKRFRALLRYVTADVHEAGLAVFGSESQFVRWLFEPTKALGDNMPIRVIRRAKGRAQIVNILRALEHGVHL